MHFYHMYGNLSDQNLFRMKQGPEGKKGISVNYIAQSAVTLGDSARNCC